jgi:hypothetical protein
MKFAGFTLSIVLLILASCSSHDPQPETTGDTHRLSSVSTYQQDENSFKLIDATTYSYSDQGRLESSLYSFYNASTQQFTPFSRKAFTHDSQGRVTLIEATIINTDVEESVLYRYRADGTLASMHFSSNVDADVAVSYLPGDTLQAVYLYSNGTSFTYRAFMKDGNPEYEKTINADNKISDESAKTFDDHINPYSLLGYIDYVFINYSKNNPLHTTSQYYESFPTAIPESYEYTYNDAGLPLTQIVTFKSGDATRKSQIKYVFDYDH